MVNMIKKFVSGENGSGI